MALVRSSSARARTCGVSRREAHGRLKHKPPQRRSEMWLGMWDVPRGMGSVLSCSMLVLTTPRRLPWPNRAGSTRNVHNNSIQPFVRTRSPTPVERCQSVVFWQWMVSTDTHDRSGDAGDNSVTLTWSSVVDGRPDRSSRGRWLIVPDVCKECSSKITHCSKVHGSYHPRTIGPGSFTRRPVGLRRASHPVPSGRPPRGGAKMTWLRYSCEYLGCSREDPGGLNQRQRHSHTSHHTSSAASLATV